VSVPIGGLAFARSVDQGDNGGSDQQGSGKRDISCDPISGNPAQKNAVVWFVIPIHAYVPLSQLVLASASLAVELSCVHVQ
jgi:hypothetical protein